MANRVTVADVDVILERDATVVTDAQADVFITTANLIVNGNLLDTSSELTDAELKEIERWLSAHLMVMKDRRVSSEGAGGVSASYIGSVGMNLQASTYGQQAMVLDRSGTLQSLNTGKKRASFHTINPESSSGVSDEA